MTLELSGVFLIQPLLFSIPIGAYRYSIHSSFRKKLSAFMARSPNKAESKSDVTPGGEETLDFDDDTLRGEKKHVTSFIRRM